MKLFYLILAHKNLAQVSQMIRSLDHAQAVFFIHIDRKTLYHKIKAFEFYNNKNVFFIRRRFNVKWGGFNMVRATISLIKATIKHNQKGYVILLSGQDFPIKPSCYIYNYLSKNYGNQYLQTFTLPHTNWFLEGGIDRVRYHWFIDKLGFRDSWLLYQLQKKNTLARPFFNNFDLFGGSQWWCITTECADYIIRFIHCNSVILDYFETTCIADEILFNTIIMNSPFRDFVVNDNLKLMNWPPCAAHPKIMTSMDWHKIRNSEALWARKFDVDVDAEIINRIEREITASQIS